MADLSQRQGQPRLKVAWISDFPIEWLPEVPDALKHLPRAHPATWQIVLAGEFERDPSIELHVLVLRKGIERDIQFERNGIQFHVLKVMKAARAPTLFWTDTVLIRRALLRIQPDLVQAWGTERGAALVGLRLPYPCLVTIQGLQSWYNEIVSPTFYQRFIAMIERRVLKHAHHVSGESRFVMDRLRAKYPHLQLHHVEHVPNPMFHAVQRRPQTKPGRLLFTGHLDRRKGGDVLFEALDRLQSTVDFEFVHAGSADSAMVESCRARTSAALWERYRPLGHSTALQVAGELAKATICVMPTRADTGPVAAKEAAVAGVPLVATSIGGIPDYITDGANGVLIPQADATLLVKALERAFHHPNFSCGQVDVRALKSARCQLAPSAMASGFAEAYRKVLKDA